MAGSESVNQHVNVAMIVQSSLCQVVGFIKGKGFNYGELT